MPKLAVNIYFMLAFVVLLLFNNSLTSSCSGLFCLIDIVTLMFEKLVLCLISLADLERAGILYQHSGVESSSRRPGETHKS